MIMDECKEERNRREKRIENNKGMEGRGRETKELKGKWGGRNKGMETFQRFAVPLLRY